MASPAYSQSSSAFSPPYPSNSSLPQPPKRRQTDMPSSAPSIKRRKASMMSTTSISSAHPLRQTSFPPENNVRSYSRSPSMDTVSLASTSVTGPKKKKPRKGKGKENADRARSATANEGEKAAKGKRKASRSPEDSDEDVVEKGTGLLMAENNKNEENAKRAMLTQHFSEDQFARFTAWRSSKLSDNTVRRLVNQTLSQSVPPTVILAIKAATKTFAGMIIEGARKVQTEWLEAAEANGIDPQTGKPINPNDPVMPGDEKRRGPLMPDHLREAYRRHVLEAGGGLAGQLGLWQQQQSGGDQRFGVKNRGKVLFK